jgi:hypothetical protein
LGSPFGLRPASSRWPSGRLTDRRCE